MYLFFLYAFVQAMLQNFPPPPYTHILSTLLIRKETKHTENKGKDTFEG